MADLNALGLNDEGISDADFDKMPNTIGGGSKLPPQPGIYRFKLPVAKALFNCFEVLVTNDQGQKLTAVFADESALRNETLSDWYSARVNNRTRTVKSKGEDVIVSDFGMLLKAVGSKPSPNEQGIITNAAYGKALIAAAEKEFLAEHTLTATCNPKRDIYKDGKTVSGEKGCGQRYVVDGYSGKNGKPDVLSIPKNDDKTVAVRFGCKCGAELRCFGELRGYRAAD
jgi:hypothetical protein